MGILDHVHEVVAYVGGPNHALIWHEAGSGKTRCAAVCAHYLMRSGKVNSVLVVCPKAVEGAWEEECRLWTRGGVDWWRMLPKPASEAAAGSARTASAAAPGVLVVHKEELSLSPLQRLRPPTCLIIDEAHDYRNDSTALSQAMCACADAVHAGGGVVLALTATPFVNSYTDAATYVRLLHPSQAMRSMFTNAFFASQVDGDPEKLRMFMSRMVVSRVEAVRTPARGWAVAVHAPNVPVTLEDRYMQEYRKSIQESQRGDAFFSKAASLIMEHSDKLPLVVMRILEAGPGARHVVYCCSVENGAERLHKLLTRQSTVNVMIITGGTSLEARGQVVDAYNDTGAAAAAGGAGGAGGQPIQVLIITRASSTGITLKETDYMHIVEFPWSPGEWTQIKARVIRENAHRPLPGSRSPRQVTFLYYMCSLNWWKKKILQEKEIELVAFTSALSSVSIQSNRKPAG